MPGKTRFRPRVESLEGREVPAAFSFQLPDGTIGSGQFATPEGVDPNQSSQSLGLGGLTTVTIGSDTYTINDYATGQYANGVLVGVTGTATGVGGTLELNGSSVTLGNDSADMALDGADTTVGFSLSDGTVGSISTRFPGILWMRLWRANRFLRPTSRSTSPGETTLRPTRTSRFRLPRSSRMGNMSASVCCRHRRSSAPYTAFAATLSQGSSSVVATKAGVGNLAPAAIGIKRPQVVLYFNIGADDGQNKVIATGTVIRIHVVSKTYDGHTFTYDYNEPTIAGETVGNISEQIYDNMKTDGWNVTRSGDGRSVIVNGFFYGGGDGTPKININVDQAGINYSGTGQPRGPKCSEFIADSRSGSVEAQGQAGVMIRSSVGRT